MKFPSFPIRATQFCASLLALLVAIPSTATTLQIMSISGKSTAQFMIDGVRRDARLGMYTDEGLLLEKISADSVSFQYNGLPQRMQLGEISVLDSQTQGQISHQIRADQKNAYMTPALVNGGNLQAEIDRAADVIVIPVADADRLNLQYRDKKSRAFLAPKQTLIEIKDGKESKTVINPKDKDGKPLTYKTYAMQLNSIRIGAVDIYGISAIVSEKPGLTTTIIGRDFLKRVSPSWNNRILTLVRR